MQGSSTTGSHAYIASNRRVHRSIDAQRGRVQTVSVHVQCSSETARQGDVWIRFRMHVMRILCGFLTHTRRFFSSATNVLWFLVFYERNLANFWVCVGILASSSKHLLFASAS